MPERSQADRRTKVEECEILILFVRKRFSLLLAATMIMLRTRCLMLTRQRQRQKC